MSDSENEYQNIVSEHLAILTNDGRGLIGSTQAAAELLKLDLLGEADLSDDEKIRLLNNIIHNTQQMIDLFEWSVKKRQEFKKSMDKHNDS